MSLWQGNLVAPAEAFGLVPRTHAPAARDSGFRRNDKQDIGSHLSIIIASLSCVIAGLNTCSGNPAGGATTSRGCRLFLRPCNIDRPLWITGMKPVMTRGTPE